VKETAIVIQKQILDLEVENLQDKKLFFDEWSRFSKGKLTRLLQDLFSTYADTDELIVFDKLEVSFSYTKEDHLPTVLIQEVQAQLEKILQSQLTSKHSLDSPKIGKPLPKAKQASPSEKPDGEEKKTELSHTDKASPLEKNDREEKPAELSHTEKASPSEKTSREEKPAELSHTEKASPSEKTSREEKPAELSHTKKASSSGKTGREEKSAELSHTKKASSSEKTGGEEKPKRLSKKEQQLQILIHFLTTGTLPDWLPSSTENIIPGIAATLGKEQSRLLKDRLTLLRQMPEVQKRLKAIPALKALVVKLPEKSPFTNEEWISLLEDEGVPLAFKRQLWNRYLKFLISQPGRKQLKELILKGDPYRLFSLPRLEKLWEQLASKEVGQLKGYLQDLLKIQSFAPVLSEKELKKGFLVSVLKYKLQKQQTGFHPRELLTAFITEIALLKKTTALKQWEAFYKSIINFPERSVLVSPLPDLLLQYAPKDISQPDPKRLAPDSSAEQALSAQAPELKGDGSIADWMRRLDTMQVHPEIIAWIHYFLSDKKPVSELKQRDPEMGLERMFSEEKSLLKELLPIMFSSRTVINRLVEQLPSNSMDKLIRFYAEDEDEEKKLIPLIENIEQLFKLGLFPERSSSKFGRLLRRQLLYFRKELKGSFYQNIHFLLKRVTDFYEVDLLSVLEAVPMHKLSGRFQQALQKLRTELDEKTMEKKNLKLEKVYMDSIQAISSRQLRLLARQSRTIFVQKYRRNPWWELVLPSPKEKIAKQESEPKASEEIEEEFVSDPFSPSDQAEREWLGLRFFLERAFLPPGLALLRKKEFEKVLRKLIHDSPKLFRGILQNGVLQRSIHPDALQLLSPDILLRLTALLYQKTEKQFQDYWSDLKHLISQARPGQASLELNKMLKSLLIRYFYDHPGDSFQETPFLLFMLEGYAEKNRLSKRAWIFKLFEMAKRDSAALKTKVASQLGKALNNKVEDVKDEVSSKLEELIPELEAQKDSFFIHNAGLILLANWLPQYFQRLQMLEQKQFKDRATQGRAVQLIQYVASGRTETPEHLLVFNKLLCGLSILDPVPETIDLSAQEAEVSEQILDAIIHSWGKLGNTSREGLRGNFLIRNGKINEEESHWTLEVEPQTYDVLLQFLSWSIGMVKLPWMEKRIQTSWK
jgi:hypothetical protein